MQVCFQGIERENKYFVDQKSCQNFGVKVILIFILSNFLTVWVKKDSERFCYFIRLAEIENGKPVLDPMTSDFLFVLFP